MTTPERNEAAGESPVAQVFAAVAHHLLTHGRVEIDGFGVFELLQRKARWGRNPRTGERIDIPAKMTVKFKPAAVLKRDIEQLPGVPGDV